MLQIKWCHALSKYKNITGNIDQKALYNLTSKRHAPKPSSTVKVTETGDSEPPTDDERYTLF